MKILVFSDVHGSLNSLKSLISSDYYKNADKVIFLGDAVMGFSRPNECVELLKDMKCECVIGNNDYYICNNTYCESFDDLKMNQLNYMKMIVSRNSIDIMKSWEKYLYLNIDDKRFCFLHYVWKDNDVFEIPKNINRQNREKMFANIDADYIVFGHEHVTSFFEGEGKKYWCVGSIGLNNLGKYLLIDVHDGKIEIEEKEIEFDMDEEINLREKANYPF